MEDRMHYLFKIYKVSDDDNLGLEFEMEQFKEEESAQVSSD
jgi:hypothetical protein